MRHLRATSSAPFFVFSNVLGFRLIVLHLYSNTDFYIAAGQFFSFLAFWITVEPLEMERGKNLVYLLYP